MRRKFIWIVLTLSLISLDWVYAVAAERHWDRASDGWHQDWRDRDRHRRDRWGQDDGIRNIQVGPRPYYLMGKMADGPLKETLQQCSENRLRKTDFSIGHRGAALQFPEHTKESYEAGARMGAGILECDVTFTQDGELVCRHAQCDLHTTTNILATPLATKCRVPFTPAEFDPVTGARTKAATARCCTSDLTLDDFKSLEGKMDAFDPNALTVEEFMQGTAVFRTDLYATGGTLLSHKESIALLKNLDTKFTPELKGIDRDASGNPIVAENNGFGQSGLTQESYARKMIQEYIDAGIDPGDVFPQSFNRSDVVQWAKEFPLYGRQAVYLDDIPTSFPNNPPTLDDLTALKAQGVNIVAPPMPALLTLNGANEIVPSLYAQRAKQAGLEIISWTTERSGRIVEDVLNVPSNQFYYQSTIPALTNDSDILRNIHVLAQDVGIIGLFSDWPGTVTYYANCMGLK
jgi:glycerophosphoryl diester phosphodiesterase